MIAPPLATVSALIASTAAKRPAHRAFVQDEATLSYRELDALMDRVAAALQRDGIRPTEAIAVCAPAISDWISLILCWPGASSRLAATFCFKAM